MKILQKQALNTHQKYWKAPISEMRPRPGCAVIIIADVDGKVELKDV